MKNINIFCILAKTGGGKAEYIKKLLEDKKFTRAANLSLLVYGTTRTIRFENLDTEEVWEYIIPDDLYYYDEDSDSLLKVALEIQKSNGYYEFYIQRTLFFCSTFNI